MKKELISILDRINEINPALSDLFEIGLELSPVGGLITHMKINRLKIRLEEYEQQLNRISQLHSSSVLSADYITQRVFPIVLSDLIEEHEDSKINLILNGFENVFIEENSKESVVLNYFDTLRDLRYLDIKRLFYLADITNEYYFEGEEEQSVTLNVGLKLQNQGLIGVKKEGMSFGGGYQREKEVTRENVLLYSYGENFLKFVTDNDLVIKPHS